ncbi:MAG: NTP transferase domain-containing protein [Desulfobacterales bacterium]
MKTASIIMAAGRGSRMKGYDGSKALLPLMPESSPFQGRHPILLNILKSLPPGPKAVVVNHGKEDIFEQTRGFGLTYCEQPQLNGTGGALLAARKFIETTDCPYIIITMGDVPFVSNSSYMHLITRLETAGLAVLGFTPMDKKQYGLLQISNGCVEKIIEWKYWRAFPAEDRLRMTTCNSGIYAARRETLIRYMPRLAATPRKVVKEIDGEKTEISEYFITDIVEYMVNDGLRVRYTTAKNEMESMGIDDLPALVRAQTYFESVFL